MTPFGRPMLDLKGRVVARREMAMGERKYGPGEALSDADRAALTDRQIVTLWQLGQIDTEPRVELDEAELERLTAPAGRGQAKQAAARR